MRRCDLLAYQYQLFGDFSCDLVVGDSQSKSYGFIEWEDGTAGCLFRQQGRKATPEWATRFEHGLSQVIDWFWKLDEMAHTEEFEERFGNRRASYFGLLVIGRDSHLAHPREQRRVALAGVESPCQLVTHPLRHLRPAPCRPRE
jgi:hypothetical protein